MNSKLHSIAKTELPWLKTPSSDNNIIICSLLRLSRNLKDTPFPGNASSKERLFVLEKVFSIIEEVFDTTAIGIIKEDGMTWNKLKRGDKLTIK